MKKCDYCGRENCDDATNCSECGTRIIEPTTTSNATQPSDRTWLPDLRRVLACVGVILAGGLLYLLSFGPVEHYCGTVINQSPAPMTYAVNGGTAVLTSVRKVRYPLWVGILYRPALMLRGNNLYARYLQWWDDKPR